VKRSYLVLSEMTIFVSYVSDETSLDQRGRADDEGKRVSSSLTHKAFKYRLQAWIAYGLHLRGHLKFQQTDSRCIPSGWRQSMS
jgi:hypothetical protein